MSSGQQAATGVTASAARSYSVTLAQVGSDFGYFNGAAGSILPVSSYKGFTLREISGTSIMFRIVMDGNRAQSTFNNVTVQTTSGTSLNITSASATFSYNGVSDRTTWQWGSASWTATSPSPRSLIIRG